MNPAKEVRRSWIGAGITAAACAVCCAGPLVALVGGLGVASAVGAWFVPALIVLAGLALGAATVLWRLRRRRRATCPPPAPLAQLGMPAVPATRRATGPTRAGRGSEAHTKTVP